MRCAVKRPDCLPGGWVVGGFFNSFFFFSLSLSWVQDKQRQTAGKCPRKVSAERGQTCLMWINSRRSIASKNWRQGGTKLNSSELLQMHQVHDVFMGFAAVEGEEPWGSRYPPSPPC